MNTIKQKSSDRTVVSLVQNYYCGSNSPESQKYGVIIDNQDEDFDRMRCCMTLEDAQEYFDSIKL